MSAINEPTPDYALSDWQRKIRAEVSEMFRTPSLLPREFLAFLGPHIELQGIQIPASQIIGNFMTDTFPIKSPPSTLGISATSYTSDSDDQSVLIPWTFGGTPQFRLLCVLRSESTSTVYATLGFSSLNDGDDASASPTADTTFEVSQSGTGIHVHDSGWLTPGSLPAQKEMLRVTLMYKRAGTGAADVQTPSIQFRWRG